MSDNHTDEVSGTLVIGTFLTLDGVMQAPGGPNEDRDGGFEHGGWLVNYYDERMGEILDSQFAEVDALLLGRKTYEIFASYWPNVDTENDYLATKLNSMPKYVASRTLNAVEWNNSTLLSGDIAKAIEDLKKERRDTILVQGSANLIQTLLAHDLVDEFRLWVFPLVLGEGKRLFGDGTVPANLELTAAETSSTGVQMLHYDRAGEIEYGLVGSDDETE
ncbi:5-amino-6-(5-phosphoribosylamino)uracil reductase [Halalkalicoccus paucihalophilus]|uniref:5-amino-6-(5-phosphoribosylamino)uracil reductase n=1 Tax=Halalkalicoccus paucihalophilus TaxID=1008153 RepID=A0A151AB61_9EURY|nr:dihydrofolate reductase family protein [Halalkalicoccus paucihalophilus]KYH24824.1 5-amino-6-(5-phosphoribosylamino)uracil reductase [Halalkalicoccus paucihalophilus]